MYEIINIDPKIFKINITLKGNSLKNLNCFVIKTQRQNIVIDTGFNCEECRIELMKGLKDLGISPAHTNLIITHFHSDHLGLVNCFDYPTSNIYMGKKEFAYYDYIKNGNYWQKQDENFIEEGFPLEELIKAKKENPSINYAPKENFHIIPLTDGQRLIIDGLIIKIIEVPGHTPGQICLFLEESGILFLGDHVLYDITPNIVRWPNIKNSLNTYLNSLEKIGEIHPQKAFPAHRGISGKVFHERLNEIMVHHLRRLNEIMDVIHVKPGSNAYEIAGKLKWSLRGKNWDEAPKQQKWFAMGETMAHLDYLLEKEIILKKEGKYFVKL